MRKVVIVGAGHVGSHVALHLIQDGRANEIVFIDILKDKAMGQALDLDDAVSGAIAGVDVKVRAGDYSDVNDADILVMSFGRSRRPGETRLDMFADSIRMARDVISNLKQVDFKGIMISISNPADIIAEYIRRAMNWDRTRCFSTGTSLETYRMMRVVSKVCNVKRSSIQGYCMGEHGNSGFIVWSKLFVAGMPFLELRERDDSLKAISLDEMQKAVTRAGDIEMSTKGCTEFGIGSVTGMLIKAIFEDEKLVWPCSVALDGEYGFNDVAVGVPCVIGKNGIERIIEVDLVESEKEKLKNSCEIIRGFLQKADEIG